MEDISLWSALMSADVNPSMLNIICFWSSQMFLTVVKIQMKTDWAVFHLFLCVCSAEKLLSLWFWGTLTVIQSLIFHLSWIEFEWCCNMFLYCRHSSKGKKQHVPLERGWLKFLFGLYSHISVWMLVFRHYISPLVLLLSLWPGTLQSCCVFMYIVFVVILLVLFIMFNWQLNHCYKKKLYYYFGWVKFTFEPVPIFFNILNNIFMSEMFVFLNFSDNQILALNIYLFLIKWKLNPFIFWQTNKVKIHPWKNIVWIFI